MSVLNLAQITSETVVITAAVTSANVAVNCSSGMLLISNTGTVAVYVNAGSSTVAATTTTNICIPAGQTFCLRVQPTFTHVAAISESSTAKVSISSVNGGVHV